MAKISACVIAKNEAGNITRCLQSMQDIVDEMIVVDTGSTDDTTKIAEQLGAKVFHYKWNNDFAAARNYALEQAKGDWIIFLDADEYIVPEKIKNVRPFIEKLSKLKTYSEEAIEAICEEAIERFSHHPEIWFYRGLYYLSIGRYQLALTSLLKSLKTNECYNDLNLNNDFYALTPIAYLNIAKLYDMMNQSAKVLDYYVRALRHDKFNQEAFHGLISLIRKQNAADIVYFLNNFYHIADEADVGFLVLHLSRLKVKKVLDYYHKVWFERFGHKEYVGMVLLIHGQFEQAFQIFAASFQESGDCGAELLAVISLLIGGDPGWLNSLGSKMKASFKKIISVFFQSEEDVQLFAEDFPSYCDLVNDFTYLCSQKQLDMFLHVGKRFLSDEAPARIGDILLKQGLFRYALDLYLYQIDKACSVTNPPGLFYCKAGFSCYKLKDFAGAATYFSQALAFGYRENDIFEFLEWSYQQCADEVIKEKFRMLKVSYGKISNSEKRLPISCS